VHSTLGLRRVAGWTMLWVLFIDVYNALQLYESYLWLADPMLLTLCETTR
jgi:hypothetical protein